MGQFQQNATISGIETATFKVTAGGLYTLSGKITFPQPSQGATNASNIVATIALNGSTLMTTTAGSDGFSLPVLCAAADTVTVQLTSADAPDNVLNAVKATISMG